MGPRSGQKIFQGIGGAKGDIVATIGVFVRSAFVDDGAVVES